MCLKRLRFKSNVRPSKPVALALTLSVPVLMAWLVLAIPYHKENVWCDRVTGSTKSQTTWFLVPTSTTIQHSALERWIINQEGSYTSSWKWYGRQTWFFPLGGARECGSPPPIYSLHDSLSERFVRSLSDSELAEFVVVMRHGSEAEQEAAIDAADKKLTSRWTRPVRANAPPP